MFRFHCDDSLSEDVSSFVLKKASQVRSHRDLEEHSELTPGMRAEAVTAIFEAGAKFASSAAAEFLAVEMLDRYIQARDVLAEEVTLVAMTCLKIAEKVEDIRHTRTSDFAAECDQSEEDILTAEINILEALSYNVTHVTLLTVIHQFLIGLKLSAVKDLSNAPSEKTVSVQSLAEALARMALLRPDLCAKFSQHETALACIWLASVGFGKPISLADALELKCNTTKTKLCARAVLSVAIAHSNACSSKEKESNAVQRKLTMTFLKMKKVVEESLPAVSHSPVPASLSRSEHRVESTERRPTKSRRMEDTQLA